MNYQATVREKLNRIDELFPLERLAKSKERWRRLWNHEEPLDRLPFTYGPVACGYWNISPREGRLLEYLDEFIARGLLEDDFIPGMFGGCHQGGMASLFGARTVEVTNEGVVDTSCERLLPTVADAARLQPSSLRADSVPARWLADDAWYLEVTGRRLPVHILDSFGPVEIAAKLWGYENLFEAATEAPELYDRVMTFAADAYMLFIDAQRKVAGDLLIETCLNAHDWVPAGSTLALGMDSLALVSPAFFTERVAPYLERIAGRYAPLTIHSCGWFPKLIPIIQAAPFINGLHLGQMSLAELVNAGLDGRVVTIPSGVSVESLKEHMKLVKGHGLRVNLCIGGIWPKCPPRE
ncbi:MAG: hypothetical protein AB1648_13865, partial [Pseudomonadota bacterium]